MSESKTYAEEQLLLEEAIARHPGEFGLKNFPGNVFRVSASASYYQQAGFWFGDESQPIAEGPILYLQCRQEDGTWLDFAKGSESELLTQKVTI